MTAPCMNLLYVHSTSIGYGRYGVMLADAIARAGVEIFDHLPSGDPADRSGEGNFKGYRSGLGNVVCWVSTPTHAKGWWADQIPVMSTMWESGRLPETFRERLPEFETLIVPSHQNVELFGQYHDNVHLVPLGIDPDRWRYVDREPPGRWFRFLIGGSGKRKGTDLTFKAFQKVFGGGQTWWKPGPEPVLVMKNPRGEDFYGWNTQIISGRLSDDEEVDLYASAHCYVQPSRGEGFGLQPLQAIAQGCPTILTGAHGHDSYAHLGIPISSARSQSDYFIYGDAGEWWEPDFDELCDRMKWVYENWETAAAVAGHASGVAHRDFTWDRVAGRFLDVIGRDRLVPYTGRTVWYKPPARLFEVQVNRFWTGNIGGYHYQLHPGRTYHEVADVKRQLYELGVLDPACMTDDDCGLAPDQLARRDEYSGAHGHCVMCGQKLNSTPTRADEIYEELCKPSVA